jgi:manganese oxidase
MRDRRRVPIIAVAVLCLVAAAEARQARSSAARGRGPAPAPVPKVTTYFIAADEIEWNYTPRGRNLSGVPHVEGDGMALATRDNRSGVIYEKAVYREYTDGTFTTLKPRPPEWEHLGILGPLIRAEVGGVIHVHFKNNTRIRWVSLHPHGLQYDKPSEGAMYTDGRTTVADVSNMVAPGGVRRYVWNVPERSGPMHGDAGSVLWMYHSHFVEGHDMNSGLVGPIVVTARGAARPDGRPKDVDREFITAATIFDETQSWLFDVNLAKQRGFPRPFNAADPTTRLPYLIYSINGMIEGNLPAMTMRKGERVRWYMFANVNEEDVHTMHWHGQTAAANHMRTDTVPLTPMGMAVADMAPDTVGTWLFHCHVNEHFEAGMHALFTVLP